MNFSCLFCQKEIGESIVSGTLGNYNFKCKEDKATFCFDDFDVMFCYHFDYLHYEIEFWPGGLYDSLTPIFRIEDKNGKGRVREDRLIVKLDYIPDVHPGNAEKWITKLFKLKAFL